MERVSSSIKDKRRNLQVDGIRGVAILLVVCFHLFCRYEQIYHNMTIPIIEHLGSLGVTIFLMISIIFIIDDTKKPGLRYIINRIIRLWPSYFISISIIFFLVSIFPLPNRTVGIYDFILNIFFINGFIGTPYVDGAHWYLTTLISIICVLTLIKKSKRDNYITVYFIWMLLAVFLKLIGYDKLVNILGGSYIGIACISVSLKNMLDLGGIKNYFKIKWFYLILISFVFNFGMLGIISIIELLVVIPVFIMILQEKLPFLGNNIFLFFGSISYPLYLIHQNISYIIQYYIEHLKGSYNIWIPFLSLIVVVFISYLLNRYIEVPVQKYIKKIMK